MELLDKDNHLTDEVREVLARVPYDDVKDMCTKLVRILNCLGSNRQPDGICDWFGIEHSFYLRWVFPFWREYSKDPCFPVPNPKQPPDGYSAGYIFCNTPIEYKWSTDNEYGRSRLRLLNWLIDIFLQFIAEKDID